MIGALVKNMVVGGLIPAASIAFTVLATSASGLGASIAPALSLDYTRASVRLEQKPKAKAVSKKTFRPTAKAVKREDA